MTSTTLIPVNIDETPNLSQIDRVVPNVEINDQTISNNPSNIPPTSIWKNKWLWLILLVAILAIIIGIAMNNRKNTPKVTVISS